MTCIVFPFPKQAGLREVTCGLDDSRTLTLIVRTKTHALVRPLPVDGIGQPAEWRGNNQVPLTEIEWNATLARHRRRLSAQADKARS